MIIFGILAISIFVLFGNNMRCVAATGDCPGFCRHKEQSCNLVDAPESCVLDSVCRAPSWPEYQDDFQTWFKKTFKL